MMENVKKVLAIVACGAACLEGTSQIVPTGQSLRTTLGGMDVCLYADGSEPSMEFISEEETTIVWTFSSAEGIEPDTLAKTVGATSSHKVSAPGLYAATFGEGQREEMWWLSPKVDSVSFVVDSMDCDFVYVTGYSSGEAIAIGGDTLQQTFTYEWAAADSIVNSSRYPRSDLEGLYDETELRLTVSNMAGNSKSVSDTIVPHGVKAVFEYEKRDRDIPNEVTTTGETLSAPTEVVFNNKSLGGYTVSEWAMGSVSRLYDASPVYQFQLPGTYVISLTVTNELSGCASTDSTTKITVSDAALGFPNAFTPNGDGMNDKFCPAFRSLKSYELTVYNRWGRKVFTSTDPTEGWDGKEGNREAAAGVYYYISKAVGYEKAVTFYRKGSVTLVR